MEYVEHYDYGSGPSADEKNAVRDDIIQKVTEYIALGYPVSLSAVTPDGVVTVLAGVNQSHTVMMCESMMDIQGL